MKKNETGLALGIIGLCLSVISLVICGYLGFVGSVLGIIAQLLSGRKSSGFVCGLLALIIGLIGGFLWLTIISLM